ncbi:hypothetical protein BH23PLA1_BH23PLA1_11740 [soil metagenome]
MEIAASVATERVASSWTGSETYTAPAAVTVRGSIVDSWVEPAGCCDWDSRLVLQVAPRGRPRELLILEADATLVPDLGWLADLGENLCHGSPVSVQVRSSREGTLHVTQIEFGR